VSIVIRGWIGCPARAAASLVDDDRQSLLDSLLITGTNHAASLVDDDRQSLLDGLLITGTNHRKSGRSPRCGE